MQEQIEFADLMLERELISQEQRDLIVARVKRIVASWVCCSCNTNDHPKSALQPALCAECVGAMLEGYENRLDPNFHR